MNKKCGKILLSGFSNAGKSSLINFLLKKKVSIVSHKVQTTNQKIRAILNLKSSQLIFVDTPGIIADKRFFNKKMSRSLSEEFDSCDLNLFILDSAHYGDPEHKKFFMRAKLIYSKKTLDINKFSNF